MLVLLATCCFGCLDTMSKVLVAHYPASALVWLRYVLQTIVMAAIFLPRMGMRLMRTSAPGLQVLRGLMLVVSSVVFVLALRHMPIAEVASIVFLAPVIVALAGGPLLGERVGARTWIALAGGFTGVLLIIRPGGSAFTWWAFLPLGCAFMFAGYQILTRKLAGHDDPITTLFYPGLIAVLVIPPIFPGSITGLPSVPLHLAMLVAIGVLGAVGHFFLIRAHALAPATLLSPFGYGQLLVILVLGFAVFGEIPDELGFTGIFLVAGSGLALVLAGRKLRA
ncbi:MAG TPA: DMT family transporter [Burkholderiales bacterium]|nr:DMT family transporter [Burkholderiales bacterium]